MEFFSFILTVSTSEYVIIYIRSKVSFVARIHFLTPTELKVLDLIHINFTYSISCSSLS